MASKGAPTANGRTVRMALPDLHPGQVKVWEERRERNFGAFGRGWWKTSLAVRIAVDYAQRKIPVLWTCFTWEPIKIVQNDHWKKVFGEEAWNEFYHKTDHILQPPGWAPIRFASLEEADRNRGDTPGLIINDEFGFNPRGAFDAILRPMLFKSNGVFWGFGTPNPADPMNDFYDWTHVDLARPEYDNVRHWVLPVVGARIVKGGDGKEVLVRAPHPYENPYYTFKQLEREWLQTKPSKKASWRIEYLCEFISGEGRQIEHVHRACCLPWTKISETEFLLAGYVPNANGWYGKGADLGTRDDLMAIAVMDRNLNRQVYLNHFLPKIGDDKGRWRQVYESLEKCDRLFPGGSFDVDETGMGTHVQEEMQNRGVIVEGFNFAGNTGKKVALFDHLTDLIDGKKIELLDIDVQKVQLEGLQRAESEAGIKIISVTKHDDICTGDALSVRTHRPSDTGHPAGYDLSAFVRPTGEVKPDGADYDAPSFVGEASTFEEIERRLFGGFTGF